MPRRGEQSHNALIENGTQLMLRSGYAATGLVELLRVAGVPKGSFYWYRDFIEESRGRADEAAA